MRLPYVAVFIYLLVATSIQGYELEPLPPGMYAGASVKLNLKGDNGVPAMVSPMKFVITKDHKFQFVGEDSKEQTPEIVWKGSEWKSQPVGGTTFQLLWEKVNDIVVVHVYLDKGNELIAASKIFCKPALE